MNKAEHEEILENGNGYYNAIAMKWCQHDLEMLERHSTKVLEIGYGLDNAWAMQWCQNDPEMLRLHKNKADS